MIRLFVFLAALLGFLQIGTAQDQTPAPAEPSAKSATDPAAPEEEVEAPERIHRGDIVKVGSTVLIRTNESIDELVLIRGRAIIKGKVRELVVISGSAEIDGEVEGDVVVVAGNATVGPKANIHGDITTVLGELKVHPDAQVGGNQVEIGSSFSKLVGLRDYSINGLFLARPFPPQVAWAWYLAAIFLLVYLLLGAMFPHQAQNCVEALQRKPATSFFAGVVMFAMMGPLFFLFSIILIASVVGIIVIPFLFCAMLFAFVFGKLAVYRFAGQQLGLQFGISSFQKPSVALLLGAIIFFVLYMVPVLGFLVWGVVTIFGLGSIMVAILGRARPEPLPIVVSSGPPPSAVASRQMFVSEGTAAAEMPPQILVRVGFWLRFWASCIDLVLVAIISGVISAGVLFPILYLAYHVIFWATKGTTIGGMVLRIKILRPTGEPIDFMVALVRGLAAIFSAVVFFLGFFWAGWSRDKQSWHDKIADTIVVKFPARSLF